MILTHRIRLVPKRDQAHYFARACDAARFAWNIARMMWIQADERGERPNYSTITKELHVYRDARAPWLLEVAREVYDQPIRDLKLSWRAYWKRPMVAGKPKYKDRRIGYGGFEVRVDNLRVDGRRCHISRMPTWIKMREKLRFEGPIKKARIVKDGEGKWYIVLSVDVGDRVEARKADLVGGADAGIRRLLTVVSRDGICELPAKTYENTRPLEHNLELLAKLQRRQSTLRGAKRGEKKSRRYRAAEDNTRRVHGKIARQRAYLQHKATHDVISHHCALGIETLDVKEMLQKKRPRRRGLNRNLSDAGMAEVGRQLRYKAQRFGTEVIAAPAYFPSTQLCSRCGIVRKVALKLEEQTFRCEVCGFREDRDVNAARNLCVLADGRPEIDRAMCARDLSTMCARENCRDTDSDGVLLAEAIATTGVATNAL